MSVFVDEAQIHVKAGNGGAGAVSFRREPFVPKGGPDGGDGGRGGDVWLVADRNVASLLGFRDHPFRRGADGTHGKGKTLHGKRGADTVVSVPVGTVVKDRDGRTLADLAVEGYRWMAAEGGRGGRGNTRFLSNRRRAPSFAEQGEVGEEHWFDLELKLMADVALVGFPNAGKSTLISVVSAAKPKIAAYPFTTLEPHLGVVRVPGAGRPGDPDADLEFVMADIPGLIEGAAEGRGLGHQFLRHVERARVLLVLLDLAAVDERTPAEQERILLDELGRYRADLLHRPRLVVGTKADLLPVGEPAPPGAPALRVSAATGVGVRDLLYGLVPLIAEARAAQPVPEPFVLHRPEVEGFHISRRDDGSFVVEGRSVRRAVALSDLTDVQALAHVHHVLSRLGVDRALARQGARDGDVVHIGSFTFEYQT